MYTKNEVTTRQWHSASNQIMELIDFQIQELGGSSKVAVVKYGDKASGRVYCVDVYDFHETPDPLDASLFLLLHDYRNGTVADLHIEQKDKQAVFRFERDISGQEGAKLIRNSYSYYYSKEAGFLQTTGDFYQELPLH